MAFPKGFRWQPTGETLGQGGQGQVVLVTDTQGDPAVRFALKTLKSNCPASAYERFDREIRAINSLSNPFVVRIVDQSGPGDEFKFYVMEFHEGARTLKSIIDGGEAGNPFFRDASRAVGLFRSIAFALSECEHSSPPIAHRDLSPANILLLPDDESIKIIDFGICQIEGTESITLVDEGLGTRFYSAPECGPGSGIPITIRTDLYSAGKVLWSAVTSRKAFDREAPVFNDLCLFKLIPEREMTWHLHHIFERTIRRDPDNRYRTASGAFMESGRVQQLIEERVPPLERILTCCPRCRWGELQNAALGAALFSSTSRVGIHYLECRYCGHIFVANRKTQQDMLNARLTLD